MRRWNGWGDTSVEMPLNQAALHFLAERLGSGHPAGEVTLESVSPKVTNSRLPAHPLVKTDAGARIIASLGQSLPDWLRMKYGEIGPVPDAVATPTSGEQVRQLLDYANAQQAVVIPYGGGTSVVGHLACPQGEKPVLCIDLSQLNQLTQLNPESRLATFGAGVVGPKLEEQLKAKGYTLGHFPQSFEYSTLGGWVVTRSSGQQSRKYGRIEQLFAGGKLEAPVGTIDIPTFPASSAGPDLREMIMGSEGRLGILTEATVRVTPLAEHESFHALFFPTWSAAEAAARELAQSTLPLSMLRLSNAVETETNLILAGHAKLIAWLNRYLGWRGCNEGKCLLMIGVTGPLVECRHALRSTRAISSKYGGVYIGTKLGDRWAQNRFRGPYLRNTLWQHGYAVDTVETAADWPRITPLMQAMEAAAHAAFAQHGEKVHAFTHLSHLYPQGSSVYSTFVYRVAPGGYAENLQRWKTFKQAVSEAIVKGGGTISHQHGVGKDHAPYLAAEKGPLGIGAIQTLAHYFDPQGMMNPGKLLGSVDVRFADRVSPGNGLEQGAERDA